MADRSDGASVLTGEAPSHQARALRIVTRTPVNLQDVLTEAAPDGKHEAALRLLDVVRKAKGGVIFIVTPNKDVGGELLKFNSTDEGYFLKRLAVSCSDAKGRPCIFNDMFETEVAEFTEHTATDRWPEDYGDVEAQGKCKDGLFLISMNGTIMKAAAKLVELRAATLTWLGAGTRHSASLHAALTIECGAVFVRSDGGTIHVLTAQSARRGVAYKVGVCNEDDGMTEDMVAPSSLHSDALQDELHPLEHLDEWELRELVVASNLPSVAVLLAPLDDATLQRICGAASCPTSFKLLSRAVEIARLVSQQTTHHGLLLALGTWEPDWCKNHVRLLGFHAANGKELQRRFQGQTLFDDDILAYLLEMTSDPRDMDGGVGASSGHGYLQFPRARFEKLQASRPEILHGHCHATGWGCRMATAMQLAQLGCICVVVSEETSRVSVFTQAVVYTEDDIHGTEEEVARSTWEKQLEEESERRKAMEAEISDLKSNKNELDTANAQT